MSIKKSRSRKGLGREGLGLFKNNHLNINYLRNIFQKNIAIYDKLFTFGSAIKSSFRGCSKSFRKNIFKNY
jgi:hypothetical protein